MPSSKRVTIATAGSGKTTGLVRDALSQNDGRSALTTYTINGASELRDKILLENGYIPDSLNISTWFTFLLRHFVRPYQRALHEAPIRRLAFVDGRSAKGASKSNIRRYYLSDDDSIYSDKISQFACALIDVTGGLPLRRFEGIYKRLYIDEVQDLSGYDLDLLDRFLSLDLEIRMVGDIRQATYKTNNSGRNAQYGSARIIDKFEEWWKKEKLDIVYDVSSHRCVQPICDLSDMLYPDLPNATSVNANLTGHDGVFAVRQSDIEAYMRRFNPQTLRLGKITKNVPGLPINFGAAKGCTFDRVLIFPHKKLLDAIKHGDFTRLGNAPTTIAKVYVGITRARQSVGFVVPDNFQPAFIPIYEI